MTDPRAMRELLTKFLKRNIHLLEQLMKENDDALWLSFMRSVKCGFCKGKDGKAKDIYETFHSALDAAKFIEKERGVYLNPYRCPHGSGWHLTKNNADGELVERQEAIFRDNEIPVKSPRNADIAWEYIGGDEMAVEQNGESAAPKKKDGKTAAPILKIECESENQAITIAGKIMEIHRNINVEKYFGITFDHAFSALMAKEFLNKEINQITAYVEKPETGQIASYTFFMEKSVMLKNNIMPGYQANLKLKAKIINNRKAWHCDGRIGAKRS
jgi:hypothetical protein